MKSARLSGEWLWPPAEEIDAVIDAASVDNPVETVFRLRALAEIARTCDSTALAALAELDKDQLETLTRRLAD